MDEQNQAPEQPIAEQPNYPEPNNPAPQPEVPPMIPEEAEPATIAGQSQPYELPAPQAPVEAPTQSPEFTQPEPSKRKKWPLFAGIAVALLVLLGGGLAYGYMWYQNPQRVIMDGLTKAVQAKTLTYTGTVNVTNPGDKMAVELGLSGAVADGGANLDVTLAFSQQSQQYTLRGSGVFDKSGVLYVRLQDADKAIKDYLNNNPDMQLPEGTEPLVDKLIAKVNDRWIKIRPSDLEDFSSSGSNTFTCLQKASDSLRSDPKMRSELGTLYQKNQFVRIDDQLGVKNGSLGYVISADENKEKAFLNDVKSSDFYKKIHDCDENFTLDEKDLSTNDVKNERTEVWFSQWQHELTRVVLHEEDKDGTVTDVSWQPTFNQEVKINTPSDAASLSELKADVQNIMMEYMLSSMGTSSSSTIPSLGL